MNITTNYLNIGTPNYLAVYTHEPKEVFPAKMPPKDADGIANSQGGELDQKTMSSLIWVNTVRSSRKHWIIAVVLVELSQ